MKGWCEATETRREKITRDLLEACELAAFFMAEDFPNGPKGNAIVSAMYREAYQKILAAIAQAKGDKP